METLEKIRGKVEGLPEMAEGLLFLLSGFDCFGQAGAGGAALDFEEHAAKGAGSAVVMNRRQTLSIMLNEEDHLRMQAIRAGLQLKAAFKAINKVDTELEKSVDFAFDPVLGYLTACPSNVGTGMRASAMLHVRGWF
jgi:protein arginine kinase